MNMAKDARAQHGGGVRDQVVMITGASSGFGEATARLLVAQGARVVLGARREDRLKALTEELGKTAAYAVTDVSRRADVQSLAQRGLEAFGRIDSLVNNAGIMPLSTLGAGRVDDWDRMIDVNIKGVLYAIDAVLGHMMERGSGRIVNVSSVAGLRVGHPVTAVYSATKFAVRAISEGLRQETSGKVQVSVICPGAFTTELPNSITDPQVLELMVQSGLGKIAQPAERVAEAIVFALAQDPGVALNEIVIQPTATR